jgi:hypothetical protein
MGYDDTAASADKWLHSDGSVTTLADEPILSADRGRAKDYEGRAAHADKWLRADGSVTDIAGKTLLEADEARAAEYASRSPGIGGILIGSGGFDIRESGYVRFPPAIAAGETMVFSAAIGEGTALRFIPCAKAGELIGGDISMSDTAAAVLG